MATIKLTSGALGNLINLINLNNGLTTSGNFQASSMNNSGSIDIDDDSIPANMLETAPVFEINYKSTLKQCIKKARKSLEIIVKEVVPTILLNSNMILDKIEQDAEQLGGLYYEYAKSDKMIQALMETVAHGETLARLFDVYARLSDGQLKLSSKITETQNQMRKYYIDTYLDLQLKDEVDENLAIGTQEKAKALEAPKEQHNEELMNNDNVIVGTENTIKMLQEKKKKAMMAKYEEVKD